MLGLKSWQFWVAVVVAIFIVFVYTPSKEASIRMEEIPCDGMYSYNGERYDCCIDCHELYMEYWKYEYEGGGLFSVGSTNCYCKKGDEIKQVY